MIYRELYERVILNVISIPNSISNKQSRRQVLHMNYLGEINDEHCTLGCTNSAGSCLWDGWHYEGYTTN